MFIALEQVSFSYQTGARDVGDEVLRDVSVTVTSGKLLAVVGHTGSGKSTLLQLMAGLLEPSAGSVQVGEPVGGVQVERSAPGVAGKLAVGEFAPVVGKLAPGAIGLVFQMPERQLFAQTVYEDVAFGPKNLGVPAREIVGRVQSALGQVGLSYDEFKDCSPFALSAGQQRRVALAGVLAMRPEVLLLDEPTAGLDSKAHDEIVQLLMDLHRSGMTMVMVSHNMEDVACMADQVLVLNKGRVLFDGTPSQVFSHQQELSALGLEVPEAVSFAHDLRSSGFVIPEQLYTAQTLAKAVSECVDLRNCVLHPTVGQGNSLTATPHKAS